MASFKGFFRGLIDRFNAVGDALFNRDRSRKFEAGSHSSRTKGWNTTDASIDSEMRMALRTIRARARDLAANNSWTRSALRCKQTDLVGAGILAKIKTENKSVEKTLNDDWNRWFGTKKCDYHGRRNGYMIQSLAVRSMLESGEVLIRRIHTNDPANPISLLLLEADHLDTTMDGQLLSDGSKIVQGVEMDKHGKRTHYYLWRNHPGEIGFGFDLSSDRIPAEDVIHLFIEQRPGQTRGLPAFLSSMIETRGLDEYDDAELLRKKTAACFVGIVHDSTSDFDTGRPTLGRDAGTSTSNEPGFANRRFSPATFQVLPPGKDITFGAPPSDSGYRDFVDLRLHSIAVGIGVPYERLTGILSDVNFSSAKMGAVKYHAELDVDTWMTIIPILCERIAEWWVEERKAMGAGYPTDAVFEWTPPARPLVDPTREIPALQAAMRAGLKTRDRAIRELGDDPELVDREFAESFKRSDKLELSFDSDGRRPTQAPLAPEEPGDKGGEDAAEDDGEAPKKQKPKAKERAA